MICLKNVSKIFRKDGRAIYALKDVNFSVEEGEFAAIVGPSGSGKTTLLFTIAGLIQPTEGEIIVDGITVNKFIPLEKAADSNQRPSPIETDGGISPEAGKPPLVQTVREQSPLTGLTSRQSARMRAEKFGIVFQLFYLVPYLTAFENAQLPFLSGPRNNKKDSFEKVYAVFKRLGLEERMNHKPEELSVGERQRAALARALVSEPRIILADEPTGNMDQGNAAIVREYLKEFHRLGNTVILVTHSEEESKYAQRIYKIYKGELSHET